MKKTTKTLFGAALSAGLILATGGTSALADGPPESNAERGNGVSICTFSGQNDEPDHPEEGGRVQSYGQIVKAVGVATLKAIGETPANLCNPNNLGFEVPWHVTPRRGGGKG